MGSNMVFFFLLNLYVNFSLLLHFLNLFGHIIFFSPLFKELAKYGKEILPTQQTYKLEFSLGSNLSEMGFRIMNLGAYECLLGMDWLILNDTQIHCGKGQVTFQNLKREQVMTQGEARKPKILGRIVL